jgi:hypothetical protein
MTCCLCTKPATTVAGKRGFCTVHRTEAVAAMKLLGDRKLGRNAVAETFVERRRA